MDESTVLAIILITIISSIIYFSIRYFDEEAIINRDLKKNKSKNPLTFNDGDIGKVSGTIECYDRYLKAPLSGLNCIYYQVIVEKRVSSGKRRYWQTLINEKKSVDFMINQSENRVLVKSENYQTAFKNYKRYNSGFLNDANEKMEEFLARFGESSTTSMGFNKTLRYEERIYTLGEKVVVKGAGYWKDEKSNPENYLIIKEYNGKVVISNNPETFS